MARTLIFTNDYHVINRHKKIVKVGLVTSKLEEIYGEN
jgi:hypothetical protein